MTTTTTSTTWRITFPPPALPWSTNQERTMHHHERARLVAAWRHHTALAVRYAGRAPEYRTEGTWQRHTPAHVHVAIPFATRRRRDPMNYCGTVVKAVIDGLVEADVFPDDTPKWVTHLEPDLTTDGLVVVTLHPRP